MLTDGFAFLRRAADARGDGAVEKNLSTQEECKKFLGLLGARQSVVCDEGDDQGKSQARKGATAVPERRGDAQLLRLLTWNIAGVDVADAVSGLWSLPDKLCAMRREIERLRPDVLALQECPGDGPCDAVPEGMKLVASVEAHPAGCFAQLYCREHLEMKAVDMKGDVPAVAARCVLQGVEVMFVSAHLFPHEGNEAVRAKEVRDIMSQRGRDAIVLMGDLNVRREEIEPLCELHGLRAMRCTMSTWNVGRNKFYANLKESRACFPYD